MFHFTVAGTDQVSFGPVPLLMVVKIIWSSCPMWVYKKYIFIIFQGLAFRKESHQLFSSSHDRSVKIWNVDERAYIETL